MNAALLDFSRTWFDALSPFMGSLVVALLIWAVLFGILSVFLALLVMWQIHRRRLLRREHRFWNIAAKFSYLIVFGACVLTGLMAGGLYGAQRQVHEALTTQLQPALAARMPALRTALAARLGPMYRPDVTARELVQPIVQGLLVVPKSNGMFERFKARVVNRLVLKAGAVALNYTVHKALEAFPDIILPGRADELTAFSTAGLRQLLIGSGQKLDFSPLDQTVPEIFGNALRKQIDAQFSGFYVGLGVQMLLVWGLVALEMLFYFRYHLPRKRRLQATAVS